MFIETYKKSNFDFNSLSPNHCYSFVLQHPMNRIVTRLQEPCLYFIAAYEIDNDNYVITKLDNEKIHNKFIESNILVPKTHKVEQYKSYDDILKQWASNDTHFDIVGIMLYSHDYKIRSKFRNPNYETVRQLRGNQPKLQFRYLALRQISHDKVREFLNFYPEHRDEFNKYNKQVIKFEEKLFNYYIKCHMKKAIKHTDLPYEYKIHIYNIHSIYINELKQKINLLHYLQFRII